MDDGNSKREAEIAEQAERCRRIASEMVDDELRRSFEDLAEEYEARLARRIGGFMLSGDGGGATRAR